MKPTRIKTENVSRIRGPLTISPNGKTMVVHIDIKPIRRTREYTMTIADGSTGEQLVSNIPLTVTDTTRGNDLLAQFRHLGIGSIYIIPETTDAVGVNPTIGNLDKYAIVWGDSPDV